MTTSDATGGRTKRRPIPSYMQPTATSKLKENVYGVDYRFTRTKSKESRCNSPEHHELDYIPPPPPPPGVPSFMRPTKTWGGKVSDKEKRRPKSRIRRRASCNAEIQTSTPSSANVSTSFEPRTPCPTQHPPPNSPTSPLSGNSSSVASTCPKKSGSIPTHPLVERRRSSYCLAPRPSIISTFEDTSFAQSRPSTFADAIRESLIQTAPVGDIRNNSKLECVDGSTGSTAVGPPTPTIKQVRSRPRRLPRYMMPTVSSKARFRE